MPEPNASDIPTAPQPAIGEPVANASALEQLLMDPSVRVQPLRSQPPAVAAKPKATGIPPKLPGDALKSEPVLQIRPTRDDDKPSATRPQKDSAKKTAAAGALDNRAQASPLGLRPAVVDPPATFEASARH
jgi:hypothetical protein